MKISLNWLKDYLDLADARAEDLAHALTFAGVEVEAIETTGARVEGVIVAQISESGPHPNADKLSVCQVDDGSGKLRQIVCGATNYRVGDKVPLAVPGTVLPGGVPIKQGKLRGVVSDGMMCSGRELGLSEDHEGLHILPADAPVGVPLRELFESDIVFEVEITPNRSDLLSHLGIARELAALTGKSLKSPTPSGSNGIRAARDDEVRLEAPTQCPFYTARWIRGVKVGPSPAWLSKKLESVGLRPINNVVDITNYILLETGQPLHAFDLAKLDGGIRVRLAEEGERLEALDGVAYSLETSDLVIADHSKAVAIGGVMGAEDTGVTETTTDILLESAYFQPASIRRTSRRLDLSSDSSYRFERGVDPQQTAAASHRATALILELAGGQADAELVAAGQSPPPPQPVALDQARCNQLLGIDLDPDTTAEILTRLGLRQDISDSHLWSIPSYRLDLTRPIDLVEEIARIHGIDRIPARHDAVVSGPSDEDRRYDRVMELRRQLTALGFDECQTIKLISGDQQRDDLCLLRTAGKHEAVIVKNPISHEHSRLRTSLVPGLIETARRNIGMGGTGLKLFEVGTVFSKHPKSPKVQESLHMALLLYGDFDSVSWHTPKPRKADFFDLIGVLEAVFPEGGGVEIERVVVPTLLLAGDVRRGKATIGRAGQLWPERVREIDGLDPVYVAEIDLGSVLKIGALPEPVQALPKFPAVTRDIAMEVEANVPNAAFSRFFKRHAPPLLEEARLFDVFVDPSGEQLPADRKSLAYSLTYRSSECTLTSEEIDVVHGRLLRALQEELNVRIR